MRIGICANMNSTRDDGIGAEWIDIYKKAGYDYVELPLAQIMQLNDKEYGALLTKLEQSGLKCQACNNFYPAHIKLIGEQFNSFDFLEYTKKAAERAKGLGAEIIVFGSAGARNVPNNVDMNEAKKQLIDRLNIIGDIIKENGIHIAIEHLNRTESNIINTFAEGLDIAKQVGHPHIKCLIDYYHFTVGNETVQSIKAGQGYIVHAHFASTLERYIATFEHNLEYSAFFKELKECGLPGRISIEAYSKNIEKEAEEGLGFLRGLLSRSGVI
ncbi:MAG TPA: sugar phosphate isomerase/epimerase family protein [Clostridia bacterium]|nr:sugar phosphate isomerase/epimerase family protein [Clostridia bacterium]